MPSRQAVAHVQPWSRMVEHHCSDTSSTFVAGSADLRSSGQAVHLQYKLPSQPVALEGADRMEIASASRFLQHECETE